MKEGRFGRAWWGKRLLGRTQIRLGQRRPCIPTRKLKGPEGASVARISEGSVTSFSASTTRCCARAFLTASRNCWSASSSRVATPKRGRGRDKARDTISLIIWWGRRDSTTRGPDHDDAI